VLLLRAEHDVLQHGEVVGQLEVLEHHADAARDGIRGRGEAHLLAVDADRSLIGLLHPVEDLHQRRLARTVLSDQCVHRARPDLHLDV
jgi:hypothetical protein